MSNWSPSTSLTTCGTSTVTTPCGASTSLDAGNEVVELGDLREHVVRDDEVGGAALRHQLARQAGVEEVDDRLDTPLACRRRDVRRRVDAERGNPLAHEVLQEVAIVRGQLEHEAAPVEVEALGDEIHVACAWATQSSEYAEKYA